MATQTQATDFAIGDGATYCGWSDRKAGTIIAKTEKSLTWQRDKAALLNGPGSGEADALQFTAGGFVGHTSGTQRYTYERDEAGGTLKFTLRANGKWMLTGAKTGARGGQLIAGRHEHYDFNF